MSETSIRVTARAVVIPFFVVGAPEHDLVAIVEALDKAAARKVG